MLLLHWGLMHQPHDVALRAVPRACHFSSKCRIYHDMSVDLVFHVYHYRYISPTTRT